MDNTLFEFKKLPDLITEIAGNLSRIHNQFPLDRTRALEQAVDTLRQIGTGVHSREPSLLEVKNNITRIPNYIQKIDALYLADQCNQPLQYYYSNTRLLPLKYVKGVRTNILTASCINNTQCNNLFTFSVKYPNFIFNFTDRCIIIDSLNFELDDNNIPMYPDEVSTRKAIENTVIYNWFRELAYLKEIDWNVFLKVEDDKNIYVQQAKNFWSSLSIPEARNRLDAKNRAYSNYNIPRNH